MSLLHAVWIAFLIFAGTFVGTVIFLTVLDVMKGKGRKLTREETHARLLARIESGSRLLNQAEKEFPGITEEVFAAARARHEQQLAKIKQIEDALPEEPEEEQ